MDVSITQIAGLAVIVAGNMLMAWELGRYFTEVRRPLLNFKPFNCRPCFTFWATFAVTWVALGALPCPWWAGGTGAVVVAFINFTIVKSKFKIYE